VVGWHWQMKIEILGEIYFRMPLCPKQIIFEMFYCRNQSSHWETSGLASSTRARHTIITVGWYVTPYKFVNKFQRNKETFGLHLQCGRLQQVAVDDKFFTKLHGFASWRNTILIDVLSNRTTDLNLKTSGIFSPCERELLLMVGLRRGSAAA
jgi:hypothetical protein